MFDMTPFKSEDGAVLELNVEEAEEFGEFYNNQLPLPAKNPLKPRSQCIRICFDEGMFWRFYGDKQLYIRDGYKIWHLDEIRLTQRDFGEIDTDSAMSLSLLFANGG